MGGAPDRALGGSRMSGMRSSAVVVTIAAVIAGLGAAGSAQAAQTDRLSTSMTSVSVRALQPSVEPGHRSTIAGNLQVGGAPGAGRPLVLEAQASGEQYF